MGSPHKAAIRLGDGSTSSDRLAAALHGAGCAPVVIVANEASPYVGMGLCVVADRRTGLGPLAGIEAALMALAPLPVCVVAGDMPKLGAEDLRRLVNAWDGRLAVAWTDRMQPLCAVVAADLVGEVSAALDRGEHGVYRLWERLGAVPVRFADAEAFTDLDTPEDLARCQ
jgi:molybdopterin-guanine dinucleotide biosynthesis protein A